MTNRSKVRQCIRFGFGGNGFPRSHQRRGAIFHPCESSIGKRGRREPIHSSWFEHFFRRFAFQPDMINLSPSNPISPTVGDILELAGLPPTALQKSHWTTQRRRGLGRFV